MGARDGKKGKKYQVAKHATRSNFRRCKIPLEKQFANPKRKAPAVCRGFFLRINCKYEQFCIKKSFFVVKIAAFAIRKGDFVIRPGR